MWWDCVSAEVASRLLRAYGAFSVHVQSKASNARGTVFSARVTASGEADIKRTDYDDERSRETVVIERAVGADAALDELNARMHRLQLGADDNQQHDDDPLAAVTISIVLPHPPLTTAQLGALCFLCETQRQARLAYVIDRSGVARRAFRLRRADTRCFEHALDDRNVVVEVEVIERLRAK